jgi:hypothetical protein
MARNIDESEESGGEKRQRQQKRNNGGCVVWRKRRRISKSARGGIASALCGSRLARQPRKTWRKRQTKKAQHQRRLRARRKTVARITARSVTPAAAQINSCCKHREHAAAAGTAHALSRSKKAQPSINESAAKGAGGRGNMATARRGAKKKIFICSSAGETVGLKCYRIGRCSWLTYLRRNVVALGCGEMKLKCIYSKAVSA